MPGRADPGLVSHWIDTAAGRILACARGERPPLLAEEALETASALVGLLTTP
jgi:hypothetical protein